MLPPLCRIVFSLAIQVIAANEDLSSGSEAPDCLGAVESLGHNLLAAIDGEA